MREFTQKEKELIVNTKITEDCFDLSKFEGRVHSHYRLDELILHLELLRYSYLQTEDEGYFNDLITMLPNSYKIVNLAKTPDLEKLTNGMIQRTI